LDGQSLSREGDRVGSADTRTTRRRSTADTKSASESWVPDVNRAEGPAQFDYLGRLAQRIIDLDKSLTREGKGRVTAIGISGSDTYDTCLILQALRPRFPEAIFFTSVLDARFWDPKELPWCRNLVVVSGYGLALHEDLQHQTAPFRDSLQTAQFAAALAALGNTNIPNLTNNFPVRRFEIGRHGPMDLFSARESKTQPLKLHPKTRAWSMTDWLRETDRYIALSVVALGLLLLGILLSPGFRRFLFFRNHLRAEALWLQEQDLGGLAGFIELSRQLGKEPTHDSLPPNPVLAPSPIQVQKTWLRETLKTVVRRAEHNMDRALEEQASDTLLAAADILKPRSLLAILRGETNLLLPRVDTAALQDERGQLAAALRKRLPEKVRVRLDKAAISGDEIQVPDDLIQALRRIITNVDLFPAVKGMGLAWRLLEGVQPSAAIWRKNRILLSAAFPDIFRSPASLSELLFSETRSWQRFWRTEIRRDLRVGHRRDALSAALKDPIARRELKEAVRDLRRGMTLQEYLKDPARSEYLQMAMLEFLDLWNAELAFEFKARRTEELPLPEPAQTSQARRRPTIPLIRTNKMLDRLLRNRLNADDLIEDLLRNGHARSLPTAGAEAAANPDFRSAAKAARAASHETFQLRNHRLTALVLFGLAGVGMTVIMLLTNLADTSAWPWEISGASVWPAAWVYLIAVLIGLLFLCESYFRLRITMLETTRQCRLDYTARSHETENDQVVWRVWHQLLRGIVRTSYEPSKTPLVLVNADEAWRDYQRQGHALYRVCRASLFAVAYLILIVAVYYLAFGHVYAPLFRKPSGDWYAALCWTAFCLFLFLSFWTLDAAFLCRWFILRISQGPTLYSLATRQHFSRQRGNVPFHVLSEWIDVSIIAQITERVGMLVYYPASLFLLIIMGNSNLIYYFPWSPIIYVMVISDFGVALASVVILRRAARDARDRSADSLKEKINQLKSGAVITEAEQKQHNIRETEQLLNDINSLRKGAFGGFWSNPVVGALLLPSGGTALIEIIRFLTK